MRLFEHGHTDNFNVDYIEFHPRHGIIPQSKVTAFSEVKV